MNPNKSHWRYNCTVILSFAKVSSLFKQWLALQAVWPDLVIYYTLGNFSKPRSTIILPTHILGNFCKSVKIFHFTKEILFGQLLWTFGDFLLVTLNLQGLNKQSQMRNRLKQGLKRERQCWDWRKKQRRSKIKHESICISKQIMSFY